jgi:hypothetical protein
LRTSGLFATVAAIALLTLSTGEANQPSLSVTGSKLRLASQQNRVSPHENVSGAVDGANLTVTYGRPSTRGRTIFGALVPYGRVWCPGADEATTLDSSKPVRFGSLAVPAGPHTIWMLPTADTWTLVISKEPSGFHTRYNARADLGRVALNKRLLDAPVEQLTFSIESNPTGPGGVITMRWEKTGVSAAFVVIP